MEEIILRKESIFKTNINNHLLETVYPYIDTNKDLFETKSWSCNVMTSLEVYKNILFEIEEFKHIRKAIEEKVSEFFIATTNKDTPFMIDSSWINIIGERGYQEFHTHGKWFGAGVLYLSEENSNIEFCDFLADVRKQITPHKGDILIFDAKTSHRVIDSDKERISLAFNFQARVE